MSSNCPPQLQLTLQPNTTSFKRSFQQFGFDLPSPVEGSDNSPNDGNDRNKRARSETSFSDSTDSSQSSMVASGSSSSSSPPNTANDIRTAGMSLGTPFGPPRLPTPDNSDMDIQMPDYPNDGRSSDLSFASQNEARYRLSLGSFNSLDNEDAVRRSQSASPALTRLPPPPVLPPLTISEGPPRLSISSASISFLETRPASPLTEAFFDAESPSRATTHSSPAEDSDFRARLTGALERLVPQSPLVPGLELDEQIPTLTVNRRLPTPLEVPPEPPILPPIPSMSTTTDIEHFNIESLLGEGPTHSLSSNAASSTPHSSISPSLNNYPLPSPILRDLRSWMHGQERPMPGFANPTSRHWQFHSYDPSNPSAPSDTVSSRQRPGEEVTRVLGNSDRPRNTLYAEPSTHSPNIPQETGLWERRSFELGNSPHDETAYSDNSSRQSITGISSSPDLNWMDHPPRLQFAFRRRSRLGSTISLVTENSLEARRMADHDHIARDIHAVRTPRLDDIDMDVPRNESIESPRDDILSRFDLGRFRAPYVHLPPFPSPSLDVAPEATGEEEYRPERDSGRGSVSPMWHYSRNGPGNYFGAERSSRSLPESPDVEQGPHSSFTQYSPSRSLSPVRPSPPVAVLPPTSAFARIPQNHRAPVGDAYNRRPHINLTRHLALSQLREPPPLLPQPDLGHAFATEGQDRDIEMGVTSQAPGQPHGQYHAHSEATSPSAISTYLQPRTYREENTRPYFWDSHPSPIQSQLPEFQHPPTLLGNSPPAPVSRLQRQALNPLDIPGRPRPQTTDNRRVLRFALPQSEEAGRFTTSSSTVRIPERMPPAVSSVNIDDRTENQTFSPIQSSYRPPEPRYLPGPPIVENVDRRRDSAPAYSPTTLDPAGFAPGPFRNTIHHSFFPRMNRPAPPTIPPLSFQESPLNSHFQSNTIPSPEETFPPRGPFSRDEPAEFNYSARVRRPAQSTEQRPPRPPFAPPRSFSLNRGDDDSTTGNRRRTPLHNSMQEARLEASRLAELLSLEPSNSPSTYGTHSLPPHSDSARLNAERQQFINFLHRHAEGERRRGSGDVTHTEGPQGNDPRPASNIPPRRFGAVDLEHWRSRARGRFRITPEFMTAARLRPGNMGDFIHDDDFDDSYENLVNLAVTIGDVKPKSTPGDILEKLETGIYKEWKTNDGDRRCPICLDDYTDHDTLLKLNNCDHWFHQNCLKQWLHTANTCPVCRKIVHNSEPSPTSPRRPSRRFGFWRGGPPPPPSSSGVEEGSSNRPRSNGNASANNRWSSPLRRRFE